MADCDHLRGQGKGYYCISYWKQGIDNVSTPQQPSLHEETINILDYINSTKNRMSKNQPQTKEYKNKINFNSVAKSMCSYFIKHSCS